MIAIRYIYILVLIFLSTDYLYAQNIDFKSSNFKSDKEGLKQALQYIKDGDQYLEQANKAIFSRKDPLDYFDKAIYYYLKANKFNPSNLELNIKLGNAYLYTNSKYKSFIFLDRACLLYTSPSPRDQRGSRMPSSA